MTELKARALAVLTTGILGVAPLPPAVADDGPNPHLCLPSRACEIVSFDGSNLTFGATNTVDGTPVEVTYPVAADAVVKLTHRGKSDHRARAARGPGDREARGGKGKKGAKGEKGGRGNGGRRHGHGHAGNPTRGSLADVVAGAKILKLKLDDGVIVRIRLGEPRAGDDDDCDAVESPSGDGSGTDDGDGTGSGEVAEPGDSGAAEDLEEGDEAEQEEVGDPGDCPDDDVADESDTEDPEGTEVGDDDSGVDDGDGSGDDYGLETGVGDEGGDGEAGFGEGGV